MILHSYILVKVGENVFISASSCSIGLFVGLFIYLFIQLLPLYGAEHTTERGSNLRLSLRTDNPPSPGEAGYTTGVYVPYSFRTVVWVLLRPTRTR